MEGRAAVRTEGEEEGEFLPGSGWVGVRCDGNQSRRQPENSAKG